MQIIYTCPNCGGDLQEEMLTCDPPIHKKVCHNCGWSHEDPREEVVRIPYVEPKKNVVDFGNGWYGMTSDATVNNACINCSSNPKNGGSGICHCILGHVQITN